MAEAPLDQLVLERHRDLRGRDWELRASRLARLLLLVLPPLALLNVFGQRGERSAVSAPGASLEVHAPAALRGGLIYETSITIRAQRDIASPRIVLSPDWLQGLTLNTTKPEASDETGSNGSLALDYPRMAAGDALEVVMQWQVNPTSTGARDLDVTLKDGDRTLAVVKRDLRVWP